MNKLLFLELEGDFESGFTAQLEVRQGEGNTQVQTKLKGKLPRNQKVLQDYRDWQQRYRSLEMLFRALKANPNQLTNASQKKAAFAACYDAAKVFTNSFNNWLNYSNEFSPIRDKLLGSGQKFQLLLQTNNDWLQRFPWECWDVLLKAEVEMALSALEYDCTLDSYRKSTPKGQVKILAILGHGADLNQQKDKQALEQLTNKAGAKIVWREQPSASQLNEALWEQGWDIIFFAGHSNTSQSGKRGEILLNQQEGELTIARLRFALQKFLSRLHKKEILNLDVE